MKFIYVFLVSVILTACGSDDSPTNNNSQTDNTPTPDSNQGTVNTNPSGSTGTATYGFGPIQAREGNQPADVDDWYNLYWFDPTPPFTEASIADWQTAVSAATAEAELLKPILIQALNNAYSSVEAGIEVSDDPVIQTLAVAAHQRINDFINQARPCGVL